MTALTTMDSLREVAEGQHIKVGGGGGTEWVRVTDGFRLAADEESYSVPFETFSGAVGTGTVETWDPREPRAGQWWSYGSDQFFWMSHPRPDVEGQMVSLRFLGGGYLSFFNVVIDAWRRPHSGYDPSTIEAAAAGLGLSVQWLGVLTTWGRERGQVEAEVATRNTALSERVIELENQVRTNPVPPRLVEQLHEVQDSFDDDDDTERLQSVLRDWGLARTADVDVTVRVTGRSEVGTEVVEEGFSTDYPGWADGVTVQWSNDITVTISTDTTGCVCHQVTRNEVREALLEDLRGEEWDWEIRFCAND